MISRTDPQETLKEGGRGLAGGPRGRLRGTLVAAQTGLALVLLVGTGLAIRNFAGLQKVDPGFNPENLLTFRITLPAAQYEGRKAADFFTSLKERVGGLPGVKAVTASTVLPIQGGGPVLSFDLEGAQPLPPGQAIDTNVRVVDHDYFQTMGIPLLEGRLLEAQDGPTSSKVIVINETMLRRYWPGQQMIGRRITFDGPEDAPNWREIVGVVADVKGEGLTTREVEAVYVPYQQRPAAGMAVIVRTAGDPLALTAAVRSEVRALDKDQPVYSIRTMEQILGLSLSAQRFGMWLLGVFGTIALLLAATGIYSVLSYSVSQRTHEIGVRMALGAERGDIVSLIARYGMALALGGLCVGAAVAAALMRLVSSLLYGVSPWDPISFFGAALLLALAALLACYIPARRAARVDPMVALRYE